MKVIVSEVHCAVLQLLLQLRVLIPSVLPAARDLARRRREKDHGFTLTQGEGLDGR